MYNATVSNAVTLLSFEIVSTSMLLKSLLINASVLQSHLFIVTLHFDINF
jgi:hypothetical protein